MIKYLTDFEIEQIAQSIAELDVVTTEQEDEVLEEFEQLLIAGKYVSQGGMDFARGALEKALGPRKAEGLAGSCNQYHFQRVLYAPQCGSQPDYPLHLQRASSDHRTDPVPARTGTVRRRGQWAAGGTPGGCLLPNESGRQLPVIRHPVCSTNS